MSNPLVSILIPAYNAKDYISDCLKSVYSQDYQNLEVIVVDDGSTDQTRETIKNFDRGSPKLILQSNQGQCHARNTAFNASKGDFIKFLDADDIISSNMLGEQISAIASSSKQIATCKWGRFYNDQIDSAKFINEQCWQSLPSVDWLLASFEGSRMLQCGAWLFPRNLIEESGLWNEDLSLIDDFDFMIRAICKADDVVFCKESKLFYRSGLSNSMSSQFSKKAAISALESLKLGMATFLEKNDSPRSKQALADIFKSWSYTLYPQYPDLSLEAERISLELGGSQEEIPGTSLLRSLAKILGWRNTKKIRSLLKK